MPDPCTVRPTPPVGAVPPTPATPPGPARRALGDHRRRRRPPGRDGVGLVGIVVGEQLAEPGDGHQVEASQRAQRSEGGLTRPAPTWPDARVCARQGDLDVLDVDRVRGASPSPRRRVGDRPGDPADPVVPTTGQAIALDLDPEDGASAALIGAYSSTSSPWSAALSRPARLTATRGRRRHAGRRRRSARRRLGRAARRPWPLHGDPQVEAIDSGPDSRRRYRSRATSSHSHHRAARHRTDTGWWPRRAEAGRQDGRALARETRMTPSPMARGERRGGGRNSPSSSTNSTPPWLRLISPGRSVADLRRSGRPSTWCGGGRGTAAWR